MLRLNNYINSVRAQQKVGSLPPFHFTLFLDESPAVIFRKNGISEGTLSSLSEDNREWLAYFLDTYPRPLGVTLSEHIMKVVQSPKSSKSNTGYIDILTQILEEVDMDDNQRHILENLVEKLDKEESIRSEPAYQKFADGLLATAPTSSSSRATLSRRHIIEESDFIEDQPRQGTMKYSTGVDAAPLPPIVIPSQRAAPSSRHVFEEPESYAPRQPTTKHMPIESYNYYPGVGWKLPSQMRQ